MPEFVDNRRRATTWQHRRHERHRHERQARTHTTNRPFRVLGIQQIAIGGLDKGALSGLWTGLLGVEKVGDYVSESENVDEDILRLGSGPHAVEIDLMQPLDPERARRSTSRRSTTSGCGSTIWRRASSG